ncbi:MAG: nuclear transport factor 2 family protein [Bacillota bacterium]
MRLTALEPLAALLVIAAPVSAHEQPPKAAEAGALPVSARAAAAAVDAFHAALERGDTKAAAALLADDALIFESGEAERSKAEYAAHHLPADAEFSRAVSSVVTRRAGSSTGNIAWIASEGRTTGTWKGKPVDVATTETMVLRRIGPSWKITHIHWSSAARR